MTLDFKEKLIGTLTNPVETFQKLRDEDLKDSIVYYIILTVIYSILSAITGAAMVSAILGTTVSMNIVTTIIAGFITMLIALFIGSAIIHIFAYIFGARKGFGATIKAICYAMTPSCIIGWIPFINIIASIWGLILEILAVRELQEISTARAALAVLIPFIVMIVFFVVVLVSFLTVVTSGAVTSVPVGVAIE